MVRVVFNPARTDGFTYTTGANEGHIIASGAVGGAMNEYSYTNQARTQMTFRLNLKSILGTSVFNSKDKFSIKLMDITAILEAGNALDMITHTSPAWIRTSNVVMYGPNFIGGSREVIMGQATNFNPNEEYQFNLEFHRADSGPNQIHLRASNSGQANADGHEFYYGFLEPINTNTDLKASRRFQWNYRVHSNYTTSAQTVTNPSLENKSFTITNAVISNNFNVITIAIPGETAVTRTGANFPIAISTLPQTPEQWFMTKRDTNRPNDYGYGIEAWFNKPVTDYIDITLELRDLLLNKLQPVMPIPAGKVLPPFTFIFDIN
jgi:hypothetical protein